MEISFHPLGAILDKTLHITSLRPFHHDVVEALVPEAGVEAGDEGGVRLLEDSLFKFHILEDLLLPHLKFVQLFNCVHRLVLLHKILFEAAEKHIPEAALPQCQEQCKTLNAQLFLALKPDQFCVFVLLFGQIMRA